MARELNEGKLVEVLPEISAAELAIHVIYPSRRHLPDRVTNCGDILARPRAFRSPDDRALPVSSRR